MNTILDQLVVKHIKKWTETFEGIKINYSYDSPTDYYILEVSPESIRRGNDQYKKMEFDLYLEFMEKADNEGILITKPREGETSVFDSVKEVFEETLRNAVSLSKEILNKD